MTTQLFLSFDASCLCMITDFTVVGISDYSFLPIRTPFPDAKFVYEDESCVEILGLLRGNVSLLDK